MSLTAVSPLHSETIQFSGAPPILPSNLPLGKYSPEVSFTYGVLKQETYTVKLSLLETRNYYYASTQWQQRTYTIDNRSGANASGFIVITKAMDVFRYPSFLWVADLYDAANVKVAVATQEADSTGKRPPVLSAIGRRVGSVNKKLTFMVRATDPHGYHVAISASSLPPGSTFHPGARTFTWASPVAGTYYVLFTATQQSAAALTDAELMSIRIVPRP